MNNNNTNFVENNNNIEINQDVKIIYVYLPRKYPPSKLKYIKKYQLEHPEKMKQYREKYEAKCNLDGGYFLGKYTYIIFTSWLISILLLFSLILLSICL